MSENRDIFRIEDDGKENYSVWERCRGIVERGIKRIGNSGSLPISGTGKARVKKDKIKVERKKK